jgi:hypothetical protein
MTVQEATQDIPAQIEMFGKTLDFEQRHYSPGK